MITDSAISNDYQSLAHLKKGAREQSPEAIKEVAKQFEALFVKMMLKSMRDTIPENELFGSKAEKMYQDMYDKQLSAEISNGRGIGLARVIERQLGGNPETGMSDKGIKDYINNPLSVTPYSKSTVTVSRLRNDFSGASLTKAPQQTSQVSEPDNDLWNSSQDFIEDLWPHALRASEKLGVDAEVLMAQSALETGWGNKVIQHQDGQSSNNLFGIKANEQWDGQHARVSSLEYVDGNAKREVSNFRVYESYKQSFDDYVDFIKSNNRYHAALQKSGDGEGYIKALQDAGYATDPQYAEKVLDIVNREAI